MNSKRGNYFPPAAESFRGVTLSILNYAAGKRLLHVSSYKSFKKRIAHPKSRIVPALVWNTNVVLYRSSTSPRNGWKKGSLQRPFLTLEERERERKRRENLRQGKAPKGNVSQNRFDRLRKIVTDSIQGPNQGHDKMLLALTFLYIQINVPPPISL